MTRNLSIWNDLRPFTIGFDDLFSQFDHYVDNRSTTFPPYNIIKGKDDLNWTIEMALAGYNKNDIEVKYADNTITIKSTHKDEDDKDTIHRGIAKRHFTRSFTTADTYVGLRILICLFLSFSLCSYARLVITCTGFMLSGSVKSPLLFLTEYLNLNSSSTTNPPCNIILPSLSFSSTVS